MSTQPALPENGRQMLQFILGSNGWLGASAASNPKQSRAVLPTTYFVDTAKISTLLGQGHFYTDGPTYKADEKTLLDIGDSVWWYQGWYKQAAGTPQEQLARMAFYKSILHDDNKAEPRHNFDTTTVPDPSSATAMIGSCGGAFGYTRYHSVNTTTDFPVLGQKKQTVRVNPSHLSSAELRAISTTDDAATAKMKAFFSQSANSVLGTRDMLFSLAGNDAEKVAPLINELLYIKTDLGLTGDAAPDMDRIKKHQASFKPSDPQYVLCQNMLDAYGNLSERIDKLPPLNATSGVELYYEQAWRQGKENPFAWHDSNKLLWLVHCSGLSNEKITELLNPKDKTAGETFATTCRFLSAHMGSLAKQNLFNADAAGADRTKLCTTAFDPAEMLKKILDPASANAPEYAHYHRAAFYAQFVKPETPYAKQFSAMQHIATTMGGSTFKIKPMSINSIVYALEDNRLTPLKKYGFTQSDLDHIRGLLSTNGELDVEQLSDMRAHLMALFEGEKELSPEAFAKAGANVQSNINGNFIHYSAMRGDGSLLKVSTIEKGNSSSSTAIFDIAKTATETWQKLRGHFNRARNAFSYVEPLKNNVAPPAFAALNTKTGTAATPFSNMHNVPAITEKPSTASRLTKPMGPEKQALLAPPITPLMAS